MGYHPVLRRSGGTHEHGQTSQISHGIKEARDKRVHSVCFHTVSLTGKQNQPMAIYVRVRVTFEFRSDEGAHEQGF